MTKFSGLLVAAASLTLAGTAQATTYISTRPIGSGSVDISITTDNTIGNIGTGNILDYTIKLTNTDAVFTLTHANSSLLLAGPAGIIKATARKLTFNFDTNGIALFQAPYVGSGQTFYCLQGGTTGCYDSNGSGEGVEANSDFSFPSVRQTGLQVIAAVASTVPEPATWAMLILGFGVVGGSLRRRSAVRTTLHYA